MSVRVSRTGVCCVLSGTGTSWSPTAPAARGAAASLPAYAHIPSPAPAGAHHPRGVAKGPRDQSGCGQPWSGESSDGVVKSAVGSRAEPLIPADTVAGWGGVSSPSPAYPGTRDGPRHRDGMNSGAIIARPAAPSSPLNSSSSKPVPESLLFSGISLTASRTSEAYRTVHATSTRPGSPAASGDTRGITISSPAARPTASSAPPPTITWVFWNSEPPAAGNPPPSADGRPLLVAALASIPLKAHT